MNRVVVTGMSGISCMGSDWNTVWASLMAQKNCVKVMPEWDRFAGLNTRLAAPILDFSVPSDYPRKNIRSMGRVSLMATVATNAALADAGHQLIAPARPATGVHQQEVAAGPVGRERGGCSGGLFAEPMQQQ